MDRGLNLVLCTATGYNNFYGLALPDGQLVASRVGQNAFVNSSNQRYNVAMHYLQRRSFLIKFFFTRGLLVMIPFARSAKFLPSPSPS